MELSSGRTVYANREIFGLEERPDGSFEVTQGYDGGVPWPSWDDDPDPATDLTADDMREIADEMIERWTRFRASLPTAS